jgi:general secretion pathway protein L
MTRMRTLLIQLPTTPASPQTAYGQAWLDTAAPQTLQVRPAPLALLPVADRRSAVTVIVPATALSWHRVTLPAGLARQPARLQAALQGLLEERLLQDPAQLHMALPQPWTAGQPLWVAVCDKGWLLQHLQALEDAGLAVQRIVPEFAPPQQGEFWHAVGTEDDGWLWHGSAEHGLTGWPLAAFGQGALCPNPTQVLAEPALAAWAQQHWPEQVLLVETASHWPATLDNTWDLAQFELASRLRQRHWLRWRQRLDVLLRQPAWRPARWGLVAVLLAQLIGLNAWAWMTRGQWQAQQDSWTAILQQSFPKVTLVIDAPVQMAREVARLRQGSGQLDPADFESQLRALGTALPAGVPAPLSLNYQDGVLQWPALPMAPAQKAALEETLASRGYRLDARGEAWRLSVKASPP